MSMKVALSMFLLILSSRTAATEKKLPWSTRASYDCVNECIDKGYNFTEFNAKETEEQEASHPNSEPEEEAKPNSATPGGAPKRNPRSNTPERNLFVLCC